MIAFIISLVTHSILCIISSVEKEEQHIFTVTESFTLINCQLINR